MVKRKATGEDKAPSQQKMDIDGDDSGSDDDVSMLDVDFEWFAPDPEVDFHGLKTLLRQLFDVDNELFDLSELTEMILVQPNLGSTIKCDGEESDPFAFLTVLNLHQHREKAVIRQITEYLSSKTARGEDMKQLQGLLSPDSKARVGLIVSERVINMPHQVIPPLYSMALEAINQAIKDKEPYEFTHYLIISKTYTEVASQLDAEDDRPQKKKKAAKNVAAESFYFHPEDEVLHKHALAHCFFDHTKQGDEGASDSKRAFQDMGIRPQGHLILIEGKKFEGAVKAVGEYLGAEA